MKMMTDPVSRLILPEQFIDEKTSLKKCLNEVLEKATNSLSHLKENYFLTFHARFDDFDPSKFVISQIKATLKIPSFRSNSMVFWISPQKGIRELLWMIAPKRKGEKLQVEFNTKGVAYLQAKGAMPSEAVNSRLTG